MRVFSIGTGGRHNAAVLARLRIGGLFFLTVTTLCLSACQDGSGQSAEEFAAAHHCCRQAGGH
ncbi:MAG TPA: hypothetical protein VMW18_19350 [Candidatus Binatia bacterium]|nr:hypothetical protein [Candidatus Binatia bacterium]